MAGMSAQSRAAWALAERQDGVIRWDQLLTLGFTRHAIAHRVSRGRLHRHWPGVYSVGRRELTRRGLWRAAVYAGGEGAALSHRSATAFFEVLPEVDDVIHISVPFPRAPRLPGIQVHRRINLRADEVVVQDGIPVTSIATALIDVAPILTAAELNMAVRKADVLELMSPDELRVAVAHAPRRPGVGVVRDLLERHTFVLTDSELERRFVPLTRRAGLGKPLTGVWLNGFKVDFYWPDLRLVVETDGLRYHRTAAQQARDRERDQAHTAGGLTPLRFTHAQVAYEARRVVATLSAVRRRLAARSSRS